MTEDIRWRIAWMVCRLLSAAVSICVSASVCVYCGCVDPGAYALQSARSVRPPGQFGYTYVLVVCGPFFYTNFI